MSPQIPHFVSFRITQPAWCDLTAGANVFINLKREMALHRVLTDRDYLSELGWFVFTEVAECGIHSLQLPQGFGALTFSDDTRLAPKEPDHCHGASRQKCQPHDSSSGHEGVLTIDYSFLRREMTDVIVPLKRAFNYSGRVRRKAAARCVRCPACR